MKVLSVLITKYIICTNFLVSNTTRNTCMQQPLALIGIQGTIFSEHEVFRVYDFSFLHFQYFSKNVKIMKVLSVLITKYIICTIFLVSNTINILI